jgi:methyl-accepting chemotaxis protein
MGIRIKIFLGFLILALMLMIAGVISIHELTTIGKSVTKMLDDNYKSIEASRIMLEALEREDSGILLLLMGKWDEGRVILEKSDSMFLAGYAIAENNHTIEGEIEYTNDIKRQYFQYKSVWQKPIVGTSKEGNFSWYYNEAHSNFLKIKHSVKDLMDLNQETMYDTSTFLKNRSARAAMPGIVSIIAAIVFTLLFNYFIHYYVASPIVKITRGVEDFNESGKEFKVDVETNDEIKRLANSISDLLHSSHIK